MPVPFKRNIIPKEKKMTKKSKTYNVIYAKGYRAGYKKAQADQELAQVLNPTPANTAEKRVGFMDRVVQGFHKFMSPK